MSNPYDFTLSFLLDDVMKEGVERYTVKDADFNDFLTFVYGLSSGDALYIEGIDWTPEPSFLAAYEAAVFKPGMPVSLKTMTMFDDFDETMHAEDHNTDAVVLVLGDNDDDDRDAADSNHSSGTPSSTSSAQTSSSQLSRKRRRLLSQDNPRKHRQLETETIQSTRYVLVCFAANFRRWASGILDQGLQITARHLDQCSAILSAPFNSQVEPKKLRLACLLLTIGKASLQQHGSETLVAPSSACSTTEPLPTLKGAELLAPSSERRNTTQRTAFTEHFILPGEVTWRRFVISHGTLPVSCTLNGHGSVILPCRFDWKNLDKSSRGGKEKATNGEGSPGDVAKLSWPDIGKRQYKADIVRRLYECMIRRRHGHLSELTNLEEFKTVYVDIVECHYYAYKLEFVLHQDLGENKLMFSPKNGVAMGVLNDWDLASTPTDSHTSRAGADPFVALDFLEADYKGGHMYHHDAESLYYILIWIAAHYNLGESKPRTKKINRSLIPWLDIYCNTARDTKRGLLLSESDRNSFYDEIRTTFKPLRETWLNSLWDLFHEAFMRRYSKNRRKSDTVTFERFMVALGC